jgi:PIN domain nuclease of toxin-antitoxin system
LADHRYPARDPFDRFFVAHASTEELSLVSARVRRREIPHALQLALFLDSVERQR